MVVSMYPSDNNVTFTLGIVVDSVNMDSRGPWGLSLNREWYLDTRTLGVPEIEAHLAGFKTGMRQKKEIPLHVDGYYTLHAPGDHDA